MKDSRFFKGRINSFKYAFTGARKLLLTEHSIMVQAFIALATIIAGFYFNISATEWMIQLLATGLVLGIEGLNTAVEKIADFIHPDYDERIGFIKDIAAGSVVFASLSALIIGIIIYYPKISFVFSGLI